MEYSFDIVVEGKLDFSREAFELLFSTWRCEIYNDGYLISPESEQLSVLSIDKYVEEIIEKNKTVIDYISSKFIIVSLRFGIFINPFRIAAFSLELENKKIHKFSSSGHNFEFNFFFTGEEDQ